MDLGGYLEDSPTMKKVKVTALPASLQDGRGSKAESLLNRFCIGCITVLLSLPFSPICPMSISAFLASPFLLTVSSGRKKLPSQEACFHYGIYLHPLLLPQLVSQLNAPI